MNTPRIDAEVAGLRTEIIHAAMSHWYRDHPDIYAEMRRKLDRLHELERKYPQQTTKLLQAAE